MLTSTMYRRLCQAPYLETTVLGAAGTRYISTGHLSRRGFNEGETNDSQLLTFL